MLHAYFRYHIYKLIFEKLAMLLPNTVSRSGQKKKVFSVFGQVGCAIVSIPSCRCPPHDLIPDAKGMSNSSAS